jgi:hypothetical protein
MALRLDQKAVTIKAKLVKMSTSDFVLLLNLRHAFRLVVEREKRIETFNYNHSIVSCQLAGNKNTADFLLMMVLLMKRYPSSTQCSLMKR